MLPQVRAGPHNAKTHDEWSRVTRRTRFASATTRRLPQNESGPTALIVRRLHMREVPRARFPSSLSRYHESLGTVVHCDGPQRRAFQRYRVRKYLLGTDGAEVTARRRRRPAARSHVTLCSRHGKRPDRSAARVRGTAASPNDACAPERRRQLAADAAHSFRAPYIVAQRLLADVAVQRQPTEAARASGRQASPATLAPLRLRRPAASTTLSRSTQCRWFPQRKASLCDLDLIYGTS